MVTITLSPETQAAINTALGRKTGQELLSELTFDWRNTPGLPPDLVDQLIADLEVTLLGGHGGVGKGFLALQIAVALALGQPVLGFEVPKALRVLYYSAEDGKNRLAERLRAYVSSLNLTEAQMAQLMQNLVIVDASECGFLYAEGVDWVNEESFVKTMGPTRDFFNLQRMVEAYDPQFTIVDGASDTYAGNEIMRLQVTAFVKMLKRVNPKKRTAVLLLVHIDRSSARGNVTDDDGYSGNSAWHNACRRRMFLKKIVDREKPDGGEEIVTTTFFLDLMKNQDSPLTEKPMQLMRDQNGFWLLPGQAGCVGDLLTDKAREVAAQNKVENAKAVRELIELYYQRKQWIGTSLAANASTDVYSTMKGDAAFDALKLDKKQTNALVQTLIRQGWLEEEPYPAPGRRGHMNVRWKVLRDPKFPPPGTKPETPQ